MRPKVGEIWLHTAFYHCKESGELLPKFLAILGITQGSDIVLRLLTSRPNLRELAKCSHDETTPGYFLGAFDPENGLRNDTWLDLRGLEDLDVLQWDRTFAKGVLTKKSTIPADEFCDLLLCAIRARDTSGYQETALYATRTNLGC